MASFAMSVLLVTLLLITSVKAQDLMRVLPREGKGIVTEGGIILISNILSVMSVRQGCLSEIERSSLTGIGLPLSDNGGRKDGNQSAHSPLNGRSQGYPRQVSAVGTPNVTAAS